MKPVVSYLIVIVVAMILSLVARHGTEVYRHGMKGGISMINTSFKNGVQQRYFSITTPFRKASSSSSSDSSGGSEAQDLGLPLVASTSAANNFDSSFQSFTQYSIAVAFQPKDREESNLFKKKHNKPSPALTSITGEDNLFVSKQLESGHIAIGVADGVGGWSEAGYDSSAISRELCRSIRENFEANGDNSPKELLSASFEQILESPRVEIGGTTACLGILTPDRKLKVANLGDSWCGLFRDYTLIEETNFQTHNFNTPYQLAKIPRHILKQAEKEGRRYIIDKPLVADEYTWDLKAGDLIMFATDGVTDNVIPKDIENFLRDQLDDKDSEKHLGIAAELFVKEVVKVSKDSNFPSAFAQELSKLTGQKYLGGKEDDITVVLVKVK